MIKILIADDHPIIRYGLKQIIADENDMIISGEAENGTQALELVKLNNYDIFILDLSMPDINGLNILKRLKDIKPNLPVLILSAHPEEQYAVKCIKAGANGYLNKIAVSSLLINAIRRILEGEKFLSPSFYKQIVSDLDDNSKQNLQEKLSHREYEIMVLLASGKTVKEIAGALSLSVPTVYSHRLRIFRKMNFENEIELAKYCNEGNLVLS
jgi:two-component system invasion response regulator UvrY